MPHWYIHYPWCTTEREEEGEEEEGGKGTRMMDKTTTTNNNKVLPKQYIPLWDGRSSAISDGKYKDIPKRIVRIGFARPGPERQDSVRNGINALRYVIPSSSICIHDAARPLITREAITRTALEASRAGGGGGGGGRGGAAVLAVKAKATIKKIITKGKDSGGNEGLSSMNDESRMMIVESTPDRNTMWEAQTPQILPYGVLNDGLDIITQSSSSSAPIEVTDDVSLVEILHSRGLYEDINVAAAEGDYDNIKLTTPQDLVFCNSHIQQQEESR
ncbi:hypothetical protein FOZ61_007989 [Perkinsus olseni]|uniref:2-C-methyl-D-erythritol 4-phosphate cytidylyltransferase-like protein n=1 Tax=Perkinsus olseni TaxID=32597 RepID=A0A7J6LFR5_PEROL|nr:hypothetical protein FOZ61_007989 [Perkinsus olseni]KAF4657850.1 hypothetical protein FOL46_007256 [Perkinsus olseni]